MSSQQTFALRYRPKLFSELRGQEEAVSMLTRGLKAGRIANAYLLCGPRGVGKTSAARILARALNCLSADSPPAEPCNECRSCREILEGRGLDLVEIDGASNRGIEDIRGIRENCQFLPVSSRFKIYLVDEVHMLTEPAFNALLKTLEEPPGHVKFVFATTHPGKLLPTVLSRCERYEFHLAPTALISAHLGEIAGLEGLDIEPGALKIIGRAASGSFRDALSLLDQLSSFAAGRALAAAEVERLVGLVPEELYLSMLEALAGGEKRKSLEIIARVNQAGAEMTAFFSGLLESVRQVVLIAHGLGDLAGESGTPETLSRLEALASHLGPAGSVSLFESLSREREKVRREDLPLIQAELSCISLIGGLESRAPGETGPARATRTGSGKEKAAGRPVPGRAGAGDRAPGERPAPAPGGESREKVPGPGKTTPPPSTAPADETPPVTGGGTGEPQKPQAARELVPDAASWKSFIEESGPAFDNLRPCLLATGFLGHSGSGGIRRLEISAGNGFCLERLTKNRDALAGRWQEISGQAVTLNFVPAPDPRPQPQKHDRPGDGKTRSPKPVRSEPAVTAVEPARVNLSPDEEKKVALVASIFEGETLTRR